MIQVGHKRFQLVLWASEDRSKSEAAVRMDFDTLADAKAALETSKTSGEHKSGLLMEWHKHSGVWDLIEQFP